MPGPLSDKQLQNRLRAIEKDRREETARDVQWIMSQPQGRRFVRHLLYERLGMQHGTFDYDARDGVLATKAQDRREGQRAIAIDLNNEIQDLAFDDYLLMLEEHLRDRRLYLAQKHAANHHTQTPEEEEDDDV